MEFEIVFCTNIEIVFQYIHSFVENFVKKWTFLIYPNKQEFLFIFVQNKDGTTKMQIVQIFVELKIKAEIQKLRGFIETETWKIENGS